MLQDSMWRGSRVESIRGFSHFKPSTWCCTSLDASTGSDNDLVQFCSSICTIAFRTAPGFAQPWSKATEASTTTGLQAWRGCMPGWPTNAGIFSTSKLENKFVSRAVTAQQLTASQRLRQEVSTWAKRVMLVSKLEEE